jgi:hypothetical protein
VSYIYCIYTFHICSWKPTIFSCPRFFTAADDDEEPMTIINSRPSFPGTEDAEANDFPANLFAPLEDDNIVPTEFDINNLGGAATVAVVNRGEEAEEDFPDAGAVDDQNDSDASVMSHEEKGDHELCVENFDMPVMQLAAQKAQVDKVKTGAKISLL